MAAIWRYVCSQIVFWQYLQGQEPFQFSRWKKKPTFEASSLTPFFISGKKLSNHKIASKCSCMPGAQVTRYNQENDRMVLTVLSQLCNPLAENMSHRTRGVDHHAHKDHRRPMSIQLSSLVKIWSHSMLSLHKNRLILVPALKHWAPTELEIDLHESCNN